MKQSILFIINPISGTTRKTDIPRLIENNIDADRFSVTTVETSYAGHASALASRAKDSRTDIVVAVGGDGTVNEVARSIVGSDTALGIIPCGSGNGLARHLMLPLDLRRAIRLINRCEIHTLDYGLINDNPFFCTCGMGFDAFISMKFAEAGRRGLATYVEKVLAEGLRYKPQTYSIEFPDATDDIPPFKAVLVSCANASQYGNNAYIAPQASMRDGLLDVIIMEPFDLIEAPQVIMEMMNKTLDTCPKIRTFKTNEIIVHRQKADYIHYDGDPLMTGADVHIRLINQGIRVIVNPNADKTRRRPNAIQTTFSNIFNDISDLRAEILRQTPSIQDINKFIDRLIGN